MSRHQRFAERKRVWHSWHSAFSSEMSQWVKTQLFSNCLFSGCTVSSLHKHTCTDPLYIYITHTHAHTEQMESYWFEKKILNMSRTESWIKGLTLLHTVTLAISALWTTCTQLFTPVIISVSPFPLHSIFGQYLMYFSHLYINTSVLSLTHRHTHTDIL